MSKLFTLSEYIEIKGASEVAREVEVDPQTVLYWKAHRSAPRPHTADKLIKSTNGLLSWASIYMPFVEHNIDAQLSFDFEGQG